uniref:Uncharacterized protein n=1 Tax=Anguilla anguilla TaxID=7936 RepID=A0A0E9TYU0_ANGAN
MIESINVIIKQRTWSPNDQCKILGSIETLLHSKFKN